jgi:hypothetical protein
MPNRGVFFSPSASFFSAMVVLGSVVWDINPAGKQRIRNKK